MADPQANTRPYKVHFYQEDDGRKPARDFMKSLEPVKRRAIGEAIREILERLGPNVVESSYGKALGDGLYEFRIDQDAEETLRKAGKDAKPEPDEGKILLRVFFHAHGDKLILLLSGYDKAEHDSKSYQNEQIEMARKLLKRWKEREKRSSSQG